MSYNYRERLPGSGGANRRQTEKLPNRQEESGEERRHLGGDLKMLLGQSGNYANSAITVTTIIIN